MARVLYIDDDLGLARLVQRDFARHGHEVVTAGSGAEGERLAAAGGFDAICLDHYMPGQDGLETLARLRALPNPPPVVYVTGSEEGRIAVAALRAGAADYVIKEVGSDFFTLLRAAVEDAAEREALRRAKDEAVRELRAARDRAEELAEQRAVLLREVNHRVANSLQLIVALTRLQEAAVSDPEARRAIADVRNRVLAIARVHRRLYTSDDVRSVALDEYLAALVEDLDETLEGTTGVRLELQAAPVRVATDKAVSLGVIVAELVTNAVKYAYPDGGGPVRVFLSPPSASEATLAVEDDGVGSKESAGGGTGVGQRIVEATAAAIGATVERDPAHPGTRIAVRFALE